MKLSATFIPGMMLLFMSVACSVQEEDKSKDQQLAQNELCFTAEFGEIDTKTAFQADETSIWWSPADEICIYYGASEGNKFTSTNDAEVPKAEFRGTLNAFTGESEAGVAYYFWAVYPYESAVSCDGESVVATLADEQMAKAGSFAPNTNIAIAKSTGLNLSFYNACSWFRFSVTKEGVKRVIFRGNNDEDVTGKFRVSMGEDNRPTAPEVIEGKKEITLHLPDYEPFEVGKIYYITLFPQVFTKGFTVTFKTDTEIATRSISAKATFLRSKYNSGIGFDSPEKGVVYTEAVKSVAAEGGEVELDFLSDTPCEAVIPDDAKSWISVVPETKAAEKQTITLNIEPNTGAARSATVIIRNGDNSINLPYDIEQSANHDYQLAIEREALIAIYNALDGDNWADGYNNNWCSEEPINEWYGIEVNAEGYVESLYLTGTGIVPSELESLSYLKRLTINYYQGNTNYEIPSCILNMQHLEYLHLYGTHLIGTLPSEIGQLQCLKYLEINETSIGGTIPSSIGELKRLEYLDLEWNNLSGELPESLGNLKNLRHIMMRKNELSGNIPQLIQELPIWKYDWGRIISQNHFNEKSMIVPVPTISGTALDGSSYYYDENTDGYNVLIQWSAQYDDYLVSQIESLNQIYLKYHDSVSFIGLVSSNREQGKESVETYIVENGINWPNLYWTREDNVIEGQELVFDGISRHEYAAPTFPAIFVFYNGKVVYWDLDVYGGVSGLDDYLSVNVLGEQPSYYISTDYSSDGKVTTVQMSSKGKGINLVLMGDAYSDREISNGKYESALTGIVNAFFSEEPFSSFKEFFNIYFVNVVSAVEGYEHDGQTLKSFFGSGTFVGGDNSKCIEYTKKCLNDDSIDDALIIVSMNDERYAGTCHMFSEGISGDYGRGLSIAYFPMGNLEDITHHEAGGHGFAKLADEYAYEYMGAVTSDVINSTKTMEPYGWWKNVDFTSDPSQVKWSQFIADERYASENIGCYEGGLTYWTGVWRPTDASIMRYNTGGFNAPSRYAIWYRIGKLAYGESWEGSYEDFVAYDQVNRTPAAAARRKVQRRNYVTKPLPQLPPPVVIGHSWREEK